MQNLILFSFTNFKRPWSISSLPGPLIVKHAGQSLEETLRKPRCSVSSLADDDAEQNDNKYNDCDDAYCYDPITRSTGTAVRTIWHNCNNNKTVYKYKSLLFTE